MANGRTPAFRGQLALRGMSMDSRRHAASLDGVPLTLTRTEFALLFILLAHPEWVYPRTELADLLHPGESSGSVSAITSHIKNLRKKLRAIRPNARSIRTVSGVGYTWDG